MTHTTASLRKVSHRQNVNIQRDMFFLFSFAYLTIDAHTLLQLFLYSFPIIPFCHLIESIIFNFLIKMHKKKKTKT